MSAKPPAAVLQKQFKLWQSQQLPITRKSVSSSSLKKKLQEQLKSFKTEQGIKEYTLLHKWLEITEKVHSYSRAELDEVYRKIWIPTALSDYRRLQPELIEINVTPEYESINVFGERRQQPFKEHDPLSAHWNILRYFVSSQTHDGTVGRRISFLVRDTRSQKYLGVICISGDFLSLKARNDSIGLTDARWKAVINNSANGSTIIPVQPFGQRYFGGKLLALLCLSDTVAKAWERKWGDKLVSVTTTNLWASLKEQSQYDGLEPYWKKLGVSKGSVPLKPTNDLYQMIRTWMRENYPYDYWEHFVGKNSKGMMLQRDNKNRAIVFAYKQLGLAADEYRSDHTRGIYFSRLYQNSDAFLKGEISSAELTPAFDNSVEALTNYWRFGKIGDTTVNASNRNSMTKGRIAKLLKDQRFEKSEKPDWYRPDAFMTFEDVKKKRWTDIGR